LILTILEDEIAKYKKKGFEVCQKRTLKYGKRIYLEKPRGLLGISYNGIYIYYVDGDSDTRNIQEFLKDYGKFYGEERFDTDDRGFFACSGNIDNGLFRELRNALIKDKYIISTIRTKILPRAIPNERKKMIKEGRIKEKATERKITKIRGIEEHISLEQVLKTIKDISFISSKKERGYENQLYQFLSSKGFPIVHERLRRGARFDLVLGKDEIAVELKVIKSASNFYPLIGQITTYKDYFERIIVVLIDEIRNPSIMKAGIKKVEDIDPENIHVIIK
jgi:hypothetical protein